ncbi:MAG: type III pantothenate kinase [Alphaproteobacteria bacterium]|nr:type III pantothenate kinase [Alphaproteobacteria bacterium]
MLLTIDIGNTNTVFALYNEDVPGNSWRLQTVRARTPDEYAAFLGSMLALSNLGFSAISDVIISSVVPETHFSVRRFCENYLRCGKPQFVSRENIPIEIDLDRPEDVGADRLVNALAVRVHYELPAIVIDFGTATTFDAIDRDGRYIGGVIATGIDVSMEALHRAASKLPKVSVRRTEKVIGRTTIEAMQSGVYWGYKSLLEGLSAQIRTELGGKAFVIATGGLAPLFARDSTIIDAVDENLTLKGLYEIYKTMKVEKK